MKINDLSLKEDTKVVKLKVAVSAEEKETHLNYQPEQDCWHAYSSYVPQVKRILEIASEVLTVEIYKGRVVGVSAMLKPEQIRLYR